METKTLNGNLRRYSLMNGSPHYKSPSPEHKTQPLYIPSRHRLASSPGVTPSTRTSLGSSPVAATPRTSRSNSLSISPAAKSWTASFGDLAVSSSYKSYLNLSFLVTGPIIVQILPPDRDSEQEVWYSYLKCKVGLLDCFK